MKLSEKAMLVNLKISVWTARKFDPKVTQEIERSHNTRGDIGRFNKALVSLKSVKKYQVIAGEIRTFHYANTLPWGDEGVRILPVKNYLDYTAKMREYKATFEGAIDEFIEEYPRLLEQASYDLNSLFDYHDYPSVSELRNKFGIDVSFAPVPEGSDFRVTLAEDEVKSIQADIETRVRNSVQDAMYDVWNRLHTAIKHVTEKLRDPDAIFRDSLIGNVKELCDILPKLNLTDNPDLIGIIHQVQDEIAELKPETLRESPIDRQDAARKADEIAKKMSGYMGT
jgi:hypothetical protein